MLGRLLRALAPAAVCCTLLVACGGIRRLVGRRRAHRGGHDDAGRGSGARGRRPARARRRPLVADADPHDYEVRPDDVKALADAALVVRSGGEVDAWLQDAVDASGTDAPTVSLLDYVRVRRVDGAVDPHWWQDPRNGIRAATAVRVALEQADPVGARGYRSRAQALNRRLRALDAAVETCLRADPAGRAQARHHPRRARVLRRALRPRRGRRGDPVAVHAGQPSAGDTAALIDTIRRERVRAIFAESSVEPKVERGDRAARPARGSVDRCGPTRSARRSRTAPPTWAPSHRTRARSPTGSAAARSPVASPPERVLDAFSAPYMQRALLEVLLAGGARGRARQLDRAAAARLLHPRGRHRHVPGARRGRAVGAGAAARRAGRGARLRRRAGAPRADAAARARRRHRAAARRRARRSASCWRRTSTSRAPGSTRCCSARSSA